MNIRHTTGSEGWKPFALVAGHVIDWELVNKDGIHVHIFMPDSTCHNDAVDALHDVAQELDVVRGSYSYISDDEHREIKKKLEGKRR